MGDIFLGVPCENRPGRKRAVQGQNKVRDFSWRWTRLGFMVSIYILRCGRGIIKFIVLIRTLGSLNVWDKLDCKYRPDWPNGSEGPGWTGQGRAGGSTVACDRSGAPTVVLEVRRTTGSGGCHQFHQYYMGRRVFLSVQQSNHNTLHTNPNC